MLMKDMDLKNYKHIGFAILGIYGILVPSLHLYQVLAVLAFSALFTLGIDFPKYYLFRRFEL
jgi:hypothetical protein